MPDVNEYDNEKDWMAACVPMMVDEGKEQDQAVAACMTMWAKKGEMKVGARHSGKDLADIQTVHDIAVSQGAMCKGKKSVDEFIFYGSEVKATALDDGSVKLGGYLVRFTDANSPDLAGDFFTAETDFGDATESDVFFNHRLPVIADGVSVEYKARLAKAKLVKDDVGIFAETILKARNEYEQAIAELGLAGKLGWSSGTAGHLMDKVVIGKSGQIKTWPLGLDASLTPTPAEPRNVVVSLKSLTVGAAEADTEKEAGVNAEQKTESPISPKEFSMDENEIKALTESVAAAAAQKAVEDFTKSAPAVPTAVAVVKDEADNKFGTIAEQMIAVKTFELGGRLDPRLSRLREMATKAAVGLNEGIPSQGGFLLEPTLTSEFLSPIHKDGVFSSKVRRLPVSVNSNYGWINGIDETSRATGSRWGGVQGYHTDEIATGVSNSKPKFRRINWELHKLQVRMYITDDQLRDVAQTNAIVRQSATEELNFMVNDDIVNGDGNAKAMGILNAPCLISQGRTTANLIDHRDILNMWQRLAPAHRAGAEWFVNSEAEPQLDALYFTGTTSVLSPYVTYAQDGVMRIKGKPVNVTEFNAALGTTGDLILADMGAYLFWEKDGVEYSENPYLQWLTDEQAFKWTYRCDGQPYLASALTPYKGTNTQSPFVALSSSTG